LPPYAVLSRIKPDSSEFHFPTANTNNQINWEVVTSPGNSFVLSQNPELGVFYQVSQPTNNPKLRYPLNGIYNFSNYKFMVVKLKNEKNNPPSILRLDLVDMNGNVNLDKVFRITSFGNNDNYNTYASEIAGSSSFDLSNITELNLYVNYGIFGKADTGNIYIQDLYLAKQFNLAAPKIENHPFSIYPNPASSYFLIQGEKNKKFHIKILNLQGKLMMETDYDSTPVNIGNLSKGIYYVLIADKARIIETLKLLVE
jgi:hypothetical protein